MYEALLFKNKNSQLNDDPENRLKSQEIDIHFGFHVDLPECHLQSEKISPIKWV